MSEPDVILPRGSGIVAPIDHTPEGLRGWILETCRYLRITPTELTKAASLAASTVNRFLRNQDEGSLSAKTISALLQAAHNLENRPEFIEQSPIDSADERPYLVDVRVMGRVAAGVFEPFESGIAIPAFTRNLYTIRVPVQAPFHRLGIGAYEVGDDHAHPAFPRGSLIVITPSWSKADIQPKDGDFVILFRLGAGQTMELTVRKFVISPSGEVWLVVLNPPTPRPEINTLSDIYIGKSDSYDFQTVNRMKRPFGLVIGSVKQYPTI